MIELFRCDRLAANITRAACERNRNRQENNKFNITKLFACEGCPGLGAISEVVEVADMGSPGKCKHPGCSKTIKIKGFCHAHLKARGLDVKTGLPVAPAEAATPVNKAVGGGKAVASVTVEKDPKEKQVIDMPARIAAVKMLVPEPDPKVDVNEALLVNLGWLIDESFEAVRQQIIAQLSGMDCPRERIRTALEVTADLEAVSANASFRRLSA